MYLALRHNHFCLPLQHHNIFQPFLPAMTGVAVDNSTAVAIALVIAVRLVIFFIIIPLLEFILATY